VADDGQTVLAVQQWSAAPRPKPRRLETDRLFAMRVAEWERSIRPPRLTVLSGVRALALEAQHVDGPHASLVLAQWCGGLLAHLPPDLVVTRPLATSWRAKVLRCGRLRREPAKRLAIAAATPWLAAFGMTEISHDVAEAWCMARFCTFWAANHPSEVPEAPRV
jgi:hypothetical protein